MLKYDRCTFSSSPIDKAPFEVFGNFLGNIGDGYSFAGYLGLFPMGNA
jgi:hypothetical protein